MNEVPLSEALNFAGRPENNNLHPHILNAVSFSPTFLNSFETKKEKSIEIVPQQECAERWRVI